MSQHLHLLVRLRAVLVSIACCVCCASEAGAIARATARLPEVPAAPQAQVEWIARSMRLNGLPLTLQRFSSALPAEAALQHYASWWSTADAGHRGTARRTRAGEWHTLALTSPRAHITVRARTVGGGSEGTVAVSANPASVELDVSTQFPLTRSATVANLQQYEDAGVGAEHISLTSTRPVALEARDFATHLRRAGWNVYRDQPARAIARGHILEAQKGAALAQVTFQPGRRAGTDIVVIWRTE